MSKYISWGNIISIFGVSALVWCLSTGTLAKGRSQMVAAVIMLTTSFTVCDVICRYMVLRGKDK